MAKQKITPGGTIDALTADELARVFEEPKPNVTLGLGGAIVEDIVDDVPMRGVRRQVTAYRRGGGSDNFIVPAGVITDLCDFNQARVAGSIINIGANPVFVYLARAIDVKNQGAPAGGIAGGGIFCGYLFPNGVFDFKLTNDCWCGPVSVYSTLGSTLVWGTH